VVCRIRSNRICIDPVPVTGRITAWTEIARDGGSSAFWHKNDRSWSFDSDGEDVAAPAEPEPKPAPITAAAKQPAATKPNPTRDMRK
jgi:hypothetical protein